MSAEASATPDTAPPRSWVGRHKFVTTFLLIVVVLVVLTYIFGWPLMQYYFHSQYQAALDAVRKNPKVTERLGEPIETVRPFPAGMPDGDTLGIIFSIRGPKGEADVQTRSRKFDGKWAFQILDVNFADGTKVDIAKEMFDEGGNDTPKFDPNAKTPDNVKVPDLPPDIVLPMLPENPE